jgi:DNA-binding NarL/FixJ family response regulator
MENGEGSVAIRIILADDHELLRKGLRALIEAQDNYEVVGEAANGLEAVRLALKLASDVILMDLAMPELNGIDATRQILEANPKIKIIALSMHTDPRMVDRILRAGALGYILKESTFEELLHAINTIMKGGTYLSPMIARDLVENLRKTAPAGRPSLLQTLSDREREVLQLLAEGCTTKEISGKLFISPKTVETHRHQVMEKLQLRSIAGLTKYAVREKLTALE